MSKIVINNDMVQQTSSHITNLFKPSYNPFMDRTSNTTPTNYFALQQYPKSNADNPIATTYNDKNIITNLFLVTEDFLTFMNRLNTILAADSLPRVLTEVTYSTSTTGYITVSSVSTNARNVVLPLVLGPTGNKASHMNHYEDFAAKGLWGTGGISLDGVGSTSIPELLLRHLYSVDAKKRAIAFQIAELYYGITNSECVAANLGFLPAKDFNSDKFTVSLNADEVTLTYPDPIEFAIHYDETIHNKNGKKLYLYFPYITSNALRPKTVGTENNLYDGQISIYTGVNASYLTSTALPLTSRKEAFDRVGITFTYTDAPPTLTSYGDNVLNDSMPVLTNAIWSVSGNKYVNQAGFTVIYITETGGGGDITFDHVDKIDFIDSLKFIIKAPTVFS